MYFCVFPTCRAISAPLRQILQKSINSFRIAFLSLLDALLTGALGVALTGALGVALGLDSTFKAIVTSLSFKLETIEERSKWIIDYLLKAVLPIPNDMRKTNNFVMKKKGLSFLELQLIGQTINYVSDNNIHAKVVGDKEVEFEGKKWHLSPLTKEIETRKGTVTPSGAYQGSQYWEYDGIKLIDIL